MPQDNRQAVHKKISHKCCSRPVPSNPTESTAPVKMGSSQRIYYLARGLCFQIILERHLLSYTRAELGFRNTETYGQIHFRCGPAAGDEYYGPSGQYRIPWNIVNSTTTLVWYAQNPNFTKIFWGGNIKKRFPLHFFMVYKTTNMAYNYETRLFINNKVRYGLMSFWHLPINILSVCTKQGREKLFSIQPSERWKDLRCLRSSRKRRRCCSWCCADGICGLEFSQCQWTSFLSDAAVSIDYTTCTGTIRVRGPNNGKVSSPQRKIISL